MINHNPTKEQIISALNEHAGKKTYEWRGGWVRGNGQGHTLWDAIQDDADRGRGGHTVFTKYYDDEYDSLYDEKELRKERDDERVSNGEEPMTDEEWSEYCSDTANFYCDDIEIMIDNKKNDDDVAQFFGITYDIIGYDFEYDSCFDPNLIIAICDCGYPLAKERFDWQAGRYDDRDYPSCGNCSEDLRTPEQKMIDFLDNQSVYNGKVEWVGSWDEERVARKVTFAFEDSGDVITNYLEPCEMVELIELYSQSPLCIDYIYNIYLIREALDEILVDAI